MKTLIMVALSTTVLLGGCAAQQGSPAAAGYQSERVIHRHYRYDDHRPHVWPRFEDAQKGDYQFVPVRRYQGRGQYSHYQWVRQP
ncbi:hypothetical protein D3C77_594390 [compost metagenome]